MAGVTASEAKAAALTVRVVEPETEPEVAVIVVEPLPTLLARPWLPAELLIVATPAADELQLTELVRFCVLPSV